MSHSATGTPISPYEADSPGGIGGSDIKRRKTTSSSGRGVASLTPDQLAKKRANDREAQRAIRERTKATIESLERQINQLESQQPYQELQAVIRQKDAVQAENDEIRRRLASILSIIQPVVGAQGLTDLATAAQGNVQMSYGQQSTNLFQQSDQYLNNGQRQYQDHTSDLVSPHDAAYSQSFPGTDQDALTGNRVWTSSRDALNQQRMNLNRNLELNESGERLTFNFLLDNAQQEKNSTQGVPNPASTNSMLSPHLRQHPQQQHHSHHPHHTSSYQPSVSPAPATYPDNTPPVWSMLPKNCAPTCPLDHILLNFLQARQRDTTNGNTVPPPAYPSVSSLLNPTRNSLSHHHSSSHHQSHTREPPPDPISQLMTDIIGKFPNISRLPEQVATLYMMFLHMRWQIHPSPANYDRLPEWLTPRPSQLFTAHPAWIDHLVFPKMRDRVIENYDAYPFENWFLPFTSGLCINWPYEPTDCLLSVDSNLHHHNYTSHGSSTSDVDGTNEDTDNNPATGLGGPGSGASTTINPVFERHIRRLENWTLGPQFQEAFPSLVDTANFTVPGSGSGSGSGSGTGINAGK